MRRAAPRLNISEGRLKMALTLKTVVSQIEQYGASTCGDLAALLGVSNETMLTFLTASVNRGELIFINGLYAESGKRALRKPTKLQRNQQQNIPNTIPAGDAAKAIAKARESMATVVNKPTAKVPDHMMELIVPTPEYLSLELRRLRSEVRRVEALKKAVSGAMRQLAKGGC